MAALHLLRSPISILAPFEPQSLSKLTLRSIHRLGNLGIPNLPTKSTKLKSFCHASHHRADEERKFRRFLQSDQKVTTLHFYVQDYLGGDNATVWAVAQAPVTPNFPSSFGSVKVVDDLMTATPDPNSEKVGRAQGTIAYTGMDETAITMNLNFYFTAGEFCGSTLCVIGRNAISKKRRELPIVGGTGAFRMARGYAIADTLKYIPPPAEYGILEYTLYVAYVDGQDCI